MGPSVDVRSEIAGTHVIGGATPPPPPFPRRSDRSRLPSSEMAHRRYLAALAMTGSAVDTPFADNSFERIVTGHFYSHLPPIGRNARSTVLLRRWAVVSHDRGLRCTARRRTGVGIADQPWAPADKHCSAACLTGTVRESPHLTADVRIVWVGLQRKQERHAGSPGGQSLSGRRVGGPEATVDASDRRSPDEGARRCQMRHPYRICLLYTSPSPRD